MTIRTPGEIVRAIHYLTLPAMAMALAACGGGSLDSQDGPAQGMVYGVVCQDVSTLSAIASVPSAQATFIQQDKCLALRAPARVNFLRTVTMPGEGQYSQFEYEDKGKNRKLWIKTTLVRRL